MEGETLWLNFVFFTCPGWILDPFVTLILKQFLFINLEVFLTMFAIFYEQKKFTKIALRKKKLFEIAITRSKLVQMRSSSVYMARFSVRS